MLASPGMKSRRELAASDGLPYGPAAPGIYSTGFNCSSRRKWRPRDPTYATRKSQSGASWRSSVRFQLYVIGTMKFVLGSKVRTLIGNGKTKSFGAGNRKGGCTARPRYGSLNGPTGEVS